MYRQASTTTWKHLWSGQVGIGGDKSSTIYNKVKAASSKFRQHLLKRKNRKLKLIMSTTKKRKRQWHIRRHTPPTSTAQETSVDTFLVVNLSGVSLNDDKISLLSKGMIFCPVPCHTNENEVLDDLESYFRHLRLKEFFADQDEAENIEQERFCPQASGCHIHVRIQMQCWNCMWR